MSLFKGLSKASFFQLGRGAAQLADKSLAEAASEGLQGLFAQFADYFRTHHDQVAEAMATAHRRSWALLEDWLDPDRIAARLSSQDAKQFRRRLDAVFPEGSLTLHGSDLAFRQACSAELRQARSAGLIDLDDSSSSQTVRGLAEEISAWGTFADPSELLARYDDAVRWMPAAFAADYPNLAKLLCQRSGDEPPFLVAAYHYFFLDAIADDDSLFRKLSWSRSAANHEAIRALLDAQSQALQGIHEKLDQLLAAYDRDRRAAGNNSGPTPAIPASPALAVPQSFAESLGIVMIAIPPGAFEMGSSPAEAETILRDWPTANRAEIEIEQPKRLVQMDRSFLLADRPVTVGQFRRFGDDSGYRSDAEIKGGYGWIAGRGWTHDRRFTWRDPGFDQTDDHPVVMVSWRDASAFCEWLSRRDGRTIRLPDEAQWEYACRAGTSTIYVHREDDPEPGRIGTAPAGWSRPNPWGLREMIGNVWEWCRDHPAESDRRTIAGRPSADLVPEASLRAFRGGSWFDTGARLRPACRARNSPAARFAHLGFRVAAVVASHSA